MKTLDVAGGTAAYQRVGQGEPLLLLHGFPFTSECFWPLLEAPPKGLELIVPDLPGFGRSTPLPGPALTMEAIAGWALSLLDGLGLERCHVGGVSMGGYAALALTRLDPSRVLSLTLLGSHPFTDDAVGVARRHATAEEAEREGTAGIVARMLQVVLSEKAQPLVRTRLEAVMRQASAQVVAQASRGMAARVDQREVLARFYGPVLLVTGALDPLVPPDRAGQVAQLPSKAVARVLPDVGHLPQLEAADEVRRLLETLPQGGVQTT
ncbi:MAG: alpha/beta fold hydrolase [Myxococcaceae bacterium]|nr:alpha/beta fold hydrolase [Myxococcaceae bacterium]